MAKGWLSALRDSPDLSGRVQVVGLVDVDVTAAERLKAEYALDAKTGPDLDKMLAETKPDVLFDVVVPSARRDIALTGFRHGCHVLTEKPMAASIDEAREILVAARAARRLHAVVQNRRYVPGVRRIRETIASGLLGELTALHADFFIGAHFGGFRDVMQHALLLDMAIHTLDAGRFMAGADPIAVYALETNPRGSWYAHGAAANAIFELSRGVVFTYRGSWVAEGGTTSWESAWRIIGTQGTLLWDGADDFAAKVVASDSGFLRPLKEVAVPPPPDPSQTHGHASVIAAFLDAIETGHPPETAGEDNIKSLSMVFGAIESAHAHQRVGISVEEPSLA
jgi:predicted dehydrogenase